MSTSKSSSSNSTTESPSLDSTRKLTDTKIWSTRTLTASDDAMTTRKRRKNALIILNTPLLEFELFDAIWQAASYKICADGGANRLYDAMLNAGIEGGKGKGKDLRDLYLPDLIKGDLDSLREDVRSWYAAKGVIILHDPSQDTTDLGKCLSSLKTYEASLSTPGTTSSESEQEHQLILIGGLSGRLDQTLHTLHALTILSLEREFSWAVGRESLACVLREGKHELNISKEWFGDTCGVLPVGCDEAKVVTQGLKWDTGPGSFAYPTSVATAISSSNHLENEIIQVTTDRSVVWTVEVRER